MGVSKRKVLVITGTAAAAATPMVGAGTAHAASFQVTNLNDSGAGSLRDAVAQANALAGADVITFQSGLTGTITLTSGEIDITGSVTVQGPGAAALTISGNDAGRIFYLYNSAGTPIDVTISGLGFTDGAALFGGAIRVKGENLTVEHSRFESNQAGDSGGAIAFDAAYAEPLGNVGELHIDDTVFLYNGVYDNGGAVYVNHGIDVVEITNSTFDQNVASYGGALFFNYVDNVDITDSVLTGSDASGGGGAIYVNELTGDLDIVRTTIDDNHLKGAGGGLFVNAGGDVMIDSTTISNNSGRAGGGVYIEYADSFNLISSTISGNSSAQQGGGIAVGDTDLVARIQHSTITENYAGGDGGGIAFYVASLELDHTIVSGNSTDSNYSDIAMYDGALNAYWSIIGDTALVGGTDNISTTIPDLLPLADNGGPTKTHMPDAGSPAIDTGNPAIVGEPEFDQRGEDRIFFVIDIGAVEVGSPAVDDEYSVDEDGSLNEAAPGVMDNDLIAQSGEVALVDGPAHGTLTLDADGSFVYTPTANFHGTDSFRYSLQLTNPKKPSTELQALPTATVTITVNPVNDPPQAINDSESVVAGVAKPVTVVVNDTDIDGDPLTITGVTQGAKGTVVINGNTIVYKPNNNASGTDTFTYTISDGQSSSTATVTVNIIGGRIPATGQSSWELVFTATALLGAGFALRGAARRRVIG